ncbi:MAG: MBL fold metallo-hydrolase [Erysipelotrichaceae bacterium]|nr:MBL fold metallo-hydrolase [Erysipelotrichaceae bacterium]
MQYHVLASGSKGNATFVYEHGTGILIDCGITKKQLRYKLNQLGFSENDIDYVLLTHDHYDHKKNIHTFDPDIVYTAKGNIDDLDEEHELQVYETYQFGCFEVTVLRLSHDATNTIGFIIRGDESLLYMTDTGYVSQRNRQMISDLNYYIIEANHDVQMLMNTRRPLFLKNRILSDTGHLDNEYSAKLMVRMIGPHTKDIVLAHLSEEANTPELALKTYNYIFDRYGIAFDRTHIRTAHQVMVCSGGHKDD